MDPAGLSGVTEGKEEKGEERPVADTDSAASAAAAGSDAIVGSLKSGSLMKYDGVVIWLC